MDVKITKYGQKELVIPFVEVVTVDAIKSLRVVREPHVDEMTVLELPTEEWQKVTIEK